jgi:hypothetical protein
MGTGPGPTTVERTVELDGWVDERVAAVCRSFRDTEFGELDYDTAVNLLVVGGLLFPPEDPDDPRWEAVYDYLSAAETSVDPASGRYRAGTDRAGERVGRRE